MSRVLVADDDLDVRELVRFTLDRGGHEVVLVGDGQVALDTACADPPDLVLLDVAMPRVDGLEVCRRLRADPRTARVRLVLLSGHARRADVEQGLAGGADAYLVKPFSPRQLLAAVDEMLGPAT